MIKINKNIAISLCCVALLTACGESSNDIQPNLPTVNSKTLTFSGKAIDGYIRGATLCLDINSNDSCDSNEPSVITDSEGSYTIEILESIVTEAKKSKVPFLIYGGIDNDTNKEFVGKLKSVVDENSNTNNITPLSTMVHSVHRFSNKSLSDSQQDVALSLGFSSNEVELLESDFVVLAKNGDTKALKAALSVQKSLESISSSSGDKSSNISTLYDELASSIIEVANNGTSLKGIGGIIDNAVKNSKLSAADSSSSEIASKIEIEIEEILVNSDNLEERVLVAISNSEKIKELVNAQGSGSETSSAIEAAIESAKGILDSGLQEKITELGKTILTGLSSDTKIVTTDTQSIISLLALSGIVIDDTLTQNLAQLNFESVSSLNDIVILLESQKNDVYKDLIDKIKNLTTSNESSFIEQQAKKLALKAFFKNYNIEVSNEVLTILSSIDIPLVTSPTKMIEIIEKIYNSEIKDIVEKLKNQLS